jgi:hypothetical protein
MTPDQLAEARCTARWFPNLSDAQRVAIFYPERRALPDPRAVTACANCPVRQACEDYAVTNREPGYWGGKSERTRRSSRSKAHHATELVTEVLVRAKHPMTLGDLARATGRSESTVRQAAAVLAKRETVTSVRVPNPSGGYSNIAYKIKESV